MAAIENSGLLYFEKHELHQKDDWIIMIHGAGGSTRTWKKQVEEMREWFNLLIIDLPGHGGSKLASISESAYTFEYIGQKIWDVVDHLDIPKIHVMGVSLGAIIAMQMKQLHPVRVNSLIMAGAIVKLDLKMKAVAGACLKLAEWIGYPRFYKIAAKILLPKKNHKKSRDIFVRESRHLTNEEFAKWTALYGSHLNRTLKALYNYASKIPTLLVMGAQDHMFLSQAKNYVAKHDFADLIEIPKAGHLSNLEKPKEFNKICHQYISSLR